MVEDNVASLEDLPDHISDNVEGFGLAELFVEAHSLEHSGLEAYVLDLEDVVDVLAISPLGPFYDDARWLTSPSFAIS
jgi:hypothetical protein